MDKHNHQIESVGENGEDYTRGIWDGPYGSERIWVQVHDGGGLTAANATLDGCIAFGETVTIEGETETEWGHIRRGGE